MRRGVEGDEIHKVPGADHPTLGDFNETFRPGHGGEHPGGAGAMDHRLGLTAGSALKAGALELPPPVRTRPVEAGLDLDGLGRHLTGEPLKPQDEGAGKEAEGGEQGHRIVRAPQEVGGADASEGQGLAGADGDAPDRASPLDGGLDVILLPDRRRSPAPGPMSALPRPRRRWSPRGYPAPDRGSSSGSPGPGGGRDARNGLGLQGLPGGPRRDALGDRAAGPVPGPGRRGVPRSRPWRCCPIPGHRWGSPQAPRAPGRVPPPSGATRSP
jgi:hypothetical protein